VVLLGARHCGPWVRMLRGGDKPVCVRVVGLHRDNGGVSSRAVALPYDGLGGPPVVLLHAGVADRSRWSEVLPRPGFRAIGPDLRGSARRWWPRHGRGHGCARGWIAVQRRAFELQRGEAEEVPDPAGVGVPAFDLPVLVSEMELAGSPHLAGQDDLRDFRAGAVAAAVGAALDLISGGGRLAPVEDPGPFRGLLLRVLW
jgi:hypothetical protein